MKTIIFLLISSLFIFQFSKEKKNNFKNVTEFNTIELDTFRINWYLNEPIDYKRIDTVQIAIVRTESKPTPYFIKGDNVSYTYYYENNMVGEMKGFQHKIDSTWIFGHSGWFMNSFKCDSKKLPLKFNLEIGSSVSNFIQFFGKPTKQDSKHMFYDFSHFRSRKKLNIYIENEKVKEIKITSVNSI
ncbi:hypothetical protein IMCC3317_43370 [Kordia antarctica]|uniref:Uncharacterized protein n=1 Tax=Kordia antarctica TaxID=1218801 RepID=A0A7L4ZR05_9FLAO|nr:hypothetical protein [Kordia antarctica]QHI38937.1 hypothetical protein IMCC3317_43370 [Kordia antarctica]